MKAESKDPNAPRRKFSITLNPYAAEMLHRACLKVHPDHSQTDWLKHDQRWLIQWAVIAFCRAVVQQELGWQNFCHGMACDLRSETPEEAADRIGPENAKLARGEEEKDTAWHHPGRGELGPLGPDFEWGGAE